MTMTSLELVEFINSQRKEGEAELRHDHFMVKVPKVLKDDAPKFLGTQRYGKNNTREIYTFPKREACLMAMSYSYDIQAKVFDRMTALEIQLAKPAIPQTLSEALRFAADLEDQRNAANAALAIALPKAEANDRLCDSSGSMDLTDTAKHLQVQRQYSLPWRYH